MGVWGRNHQGFGFCTKAFLMVSDPLDGLYLVIYGRSQYRWSFTPLWCP